MNRGNLLGGLIRVVAVTGLTVVIAAGAHADSAADARAVLKSMSDYLASQKTIEFTFDSAIEVITPEI